MKRVEKRRSWNHLPPATTSRAAFNTSGTICDIGRLRSMIDEAAKYALACGLVGKREGDSALRGAVRRWPVAGPRSN
jgi:hypothetical protein